MWRVLGCYTTFASLVSCLGGHRIIFLGGFEYAIVLLVVRGFCDAAAAATAGGDRYLLDLW